MIDPLSGALPFLPDLARLERAVAEAFVAADGRPLSLEDLRAESPETVASLPLVLSPGVALVPSRWPVVSLWRTRFESDDARVSVELERRPEKALVFRRAGSVSVAALDVDETALVAAATAGGITLSALERRFAPSGRPAAVASLLAAFRSCVERELFANPRSAGLPATAI